MVFVLCITFYLLIPLRRPLSSLCSCCTCCGKKKQGYTHAERWEAYWALVVMIVLAMGVGSFVCSDLLNSYAVFVCFKCFPVQMSVALLFIAVHR